MAKHRAPIVVRIWPDGYSSESINAFVHDWDDRGGFTLAADHPAAQAMWGQLHKREYLITVLDSEELEWHADMMSVGTGEYRGRFVIRCSPRRDRLRNRLDFDWRLIEAGLVA